MTHELTFEQIQKSKRAFDMFKTDQLNSQEGYLSISKLLQCLLELGFELGNEEIQEMKKTMNLSEKIDFSCFLRITAVKFKQLELVKELESAFRAFDKNNNGYLTYKELRSIITDSGPCLSIENANLLLKELGYSDDNSQVINYKAFVSDSL